MRNIFGDRAFLKSVIRIGLPIALQNLLVNASTMIDTMMVGSYGRSLGAAYGDIILSAVGLGSQYASLFFSAFFGFTSGGIVFFCQFWGARDEQGIRRAYGLATSCMLVVALLMGGAALLAPGFVLGIYTDKSEIIQVGIPYLRLVGLYFPLQALGMAMSALLRSTERVKLPLLASIFSQVTNVVINWLLIFGKFGLPELGVTGAAVGTLAGGLVYVVILYVYCILDRNTLILRVKEHYRWTRAFVRLYFTKCAPILANEILYGVGQLMINIVMGRQPEAGIAAMTVFRSIERLIFAFFSGFTNASAVIVGKHIGAGEPAEGLAAAKRFAFLCPLVTFVVCLLIVAARGPLLGLFGLTGEALAYGKVMLLIYVVAGTLRTCNYIINDTFRAGGETVYGTVVEIACLLLVTVPMVFLGGMVWHLPFLAVFALMFIDDPIRLPAMFRRLYSGRWIKPVTPEGQEAMPAFHQALVREKGEG